MTWRAGDPNEVVRTILRDRRFHPPPQAAAPAPVDVWEPVRAWAVEHLWKPLQRAFELIGNGFGAVSNIGGWIGIGIDVAIVLLVVVLLVRTVLAFTRARREAPGLFAERLIDRAGTSVDWRRRAAEAAARGEFAAAIAGLFRASLAMLDARALVAFDGARTPGEYRRLVRRARPTSATPFDALADGFVRATYAPEPPGSGDYEAAARALAAFEPALLT